MRERDPGDWHVVLTDLTMPNMTGVELAQKILSSSNPPPVVLVSGHFGVVESREESLIMSAAVLHKPVVPEELHRALRDVLAGRRGRGISPVF